MKKPISFFEFCKQILLHPIRFLDTYFPQEEAQAMNGEVDAKEFEEIKADPRLKHHAKKICTWTIPCLVWFFFHVCLEHHVLQSGLCGAFAKMVGNHSEL